MIGARFLPLCYDHCFVKTSYCDWRPLQVVDIGSQFIVNGEEAWYKRHRQKVRKLRSQGVPVLDLVIGPSQAEILLRVTSGIAAELIKAHDANQIVSLNELRAKLSKKFGFGGVPRLVDIISAIPDEYKKALLPKLKARPIRTASGVCHFTLKTF